MSIILKQSTSIDVRIGPFVDVSDGFTPETGITLGTVDEAELLKQNGAATVDISSNTWAAVTGCDGWYDLTLTTTDTNTVGELIVVIQDDSVCLPVHQRFQVVEEAVYDALFAASAAGPLQSTTAGRKLDVTATGAAGIDWANVENQSTSVNLSSTTTNLVNTTTTNTDMRGTDSAALASNYTAARAGYLDNINGHTAQTGDSYARIGAPTGATISEDIANVDTVVDNTYASLVATTSAVDDPGAAATTTTFNTDLTEGDNHWNDQVIVFTSGILAGQARVITTYAQTNGAITLDEALTSAPADNVTFSILSSHVHPKSQVADAVWDEATSGHTTVGTYGAQERDAEIKALIEQQRQRHTVQGNIYFVDPTNGDTHASGNRGGYLDPYNSIQDCHDNAVTDSNHDCIILISGAGGGVTTLTEDVALSKRYLQVRGPGRDFIVQAATNTDTFTLTADGIGLEGFQIKTTGAGSGKGVQATGADFIGLRGLWLTDTRGDAITITNCSNAVVESCNLQNTGQSGAGDGISIIAGSTQTSSYCKIRGNFVENTAGDGIVIDTTGGGTITSTTIQGNFLFGNDDAINIVDSGVADTVVCDNRFADNTRDFVNASTTATYTNNEDIIECIYLDTVNGDDGDPGIPSQPVQTIARAKTLADDLSKSICVISGSSFTLAADMSGYTFTGHGYTVALGGQSISGARFEGATISGTGTGANQPSFFKCTIGTATLAPSVFEQCSFTTTLTAGSAGAWVMDFCQSGVAGTSAPTFNLASTNNNTVDITNWARGLTLSGLAANDVATVNGVMNTLTLNGADATVNVSGQYGTLTNNLTGSPTVSTTNAFKTGDVASILEDTGTTLDGKIDTIDTNVDTLIVNVPDVISLANINAEVDTAFTTQMADSVSTDGSIATREQALYMITQMLTEFAISGTTYTVKKVDGSTTLMTFTLDDATNPTSITRAT